MAKKIPITPKRKPIEQYEHRGKQRVNNPPVGLVTPDSDPDVKSGQPKKTYNYDPHLDPQLIWAGKAEHTSFEVPTVSLHVHERIDPRTIIEAVRKKNGANYEQMSLFSGKGENPPLREAIDFYRHPHNWSNRLIAGDSLLVMNSLIEKEGLGGQVQMFYFDPPYGIKYGSNFQPFVNKRDVKDGKDEDLTAEPEMVKAFRDTWELGIHSYLTYLRDRLLLARELLSENGSVFIQISDENIHYVRGLLDEVFGVANFCALIPFRKKTMPFGATLLEQMDDFILWYAKSKPSVKYRSLFQRKDVEGDSNWRMYETPDGKRVEMTKEQVNNHALLPEGARLFTQKSLEPSGVMESGMFDFEFEGRIFRPPSNGWATGPEGMERLKKARRLVAGQDYLRYILYLDDYPITSITIPWQDVSWSGFAEPKIYAVQTNTQVIRRCMLLTTDPGDLVFDPTCGSGTTAFVAEQWGRRWITCDTSRVSTTLAKQRLMTSVFDYYDLAHPEEGVGSGFIYKTAQHISLKAIANNEPGAQEILYDQPHVDIARTRVAGPFTVEAVPAPVVRPMDTIRLTHESPMEGDVSITRTGETLRQREWRDQMLKSGIRGKNGQYILFSRIEPLSGTRWLHAEADTKPNEGDAVTIREPMAEYKKPQHVVISFGSEFAPLEQRQVELAWEEARSLAQKPSLVVFAAFQFDPEAAKDIDETDPVKTGMTFLKVQMNADLSTDDLKKKRASNESFWLIGQPDVTLRKIQRGESQGKWEVEVNGFDYYNTRTGTIDSGGTDKISMWLLDPDYDGRSLFARQVFFPMSGENEGWAKLARNLKAEIDGELIEAYRGTVSLPFNLGKRGQVAVKIVDDRGIESLKILEVK